MLNEETKNGMNTGGTEIMATNPAGIAESLNAANNMVVAEAEPDDADRTELTAEEMAKVKALVLEINIADEAYVSKYGSDAMEEVRIAGTAAVKGAKIGDIEGASKIITDMESKLGEFRAFVIAKKAYDNIKRELKLLYKKFEPVEHYVTKIDKDLDRYILTFGKDIALDEERYKANYTTSRKLLVNIKAGRLALQKAREVTLVELQNKAAQTQARDDQQAASRFEKKCDDFELQLVELEKSRTLAFLRGPQIEMQKDAKRTVGRSLENMKNHAIPTLFDAMAAALGMTHLKKGIQLANTTRKTTDDMIKLVADMTGQGALAAEKARGEGFTSMEAILYAVDKYLEDSAALKAVVQENLRNARSAVLELEKLEDKVVAANKQ